MKNYKLTANAPAKEWLEAYPLGNGKLGAMLYGTIGEERIILNQESVWSCGKRNRENPDSLSALSNVRNLVMKGELEKAEEEVYTRMLSHPFSLGHYEPLAELKLVFDKRIPHVSELYIPKTETFDAYSRTLNMDSGIYSCSYEKDGIQYEREAFISYPDQVMAIRIHASEKIGMRLELDREGEFESIGGSHDTMLLSGTGRGSAPRFVCMTKTISDGNVKRTGFYTDVENASSVVIFIAGTTSFYGYDPQTWCEDKIEKACQKGYEKIREDHIKDVKALFERVTFDVGEADGQENSAELFYAYGRYLLIASSRPGSLPSNLQGLWNKDMNPMWGSGYTININLQMNYWMAEGANLSECHEPLLEFIKKMIPNGKEVAQKKYGCRGAVAHHNTDIFGDCDTNAFWMPASLWPMGLAWLSMHIYDHYYYTKDEKFALEYYEALKEIAIFYLDYLIKDEQGNLVTCPSTSPENTYLLPNGQKSTLCYGPAMDTQIIREMWGDFIGLHDALLAEGKISGKDLEVEEIRRMIPLLPKDKIGSRGQVLEWQKEYDEFEKGHRHVSHLFALYPGNQIERKRTPELFEAAKVTLEERATLSDRTPGWTKAWAMNLWARLGEGDRAYENLESLIKDNLAPNMFDLHPALAPGMPTVFQIDGNFGGVAGINEMLLQTRKKEDGEYEIIPLPALPKSWPSGCIKGVRVKGNQTVDLSWENYKVTQLLVRTEQ